MLEAYLSYYLNQYLGQWVEGIDQKSLRISIYKGDVVLKNLQLRQDALAALDLPITVRAGLLGTLTLKVPWSSLGTLPVEVKVDRLFLLASPADDKRGKGVRRESDIEPAFQLAKRQRVAAQEERWVRELAAAQEQQDAAQRATSGAAAKEQGGGGMGGMLKAVIDTVIGNLQLSISNVHIRYEDAQTNPGHPFACGITLDSITGYTVDEAGREAFITNNPLQMLRKALRLRRMSVYFDTDAEFWRPESAASWRQLAPHEWDEWFLHGISAERQERGGTARHRQYVLQPVDGRALYTRRGAGVQHKDDEPVVEIDLQLDVVAVRLSQPQYQSYHMLLAEVSLFTARVAHNAYRPCLRPAAGEPARLWWRYAAKAVQQQVLARKLTWSQAIKFARMRKEYVPLYAEHLRSPIDPSRPNDRLPKGIVDMDRELPEQTIVMFRRLAHVKVEREKRQKAAVEGAKSSGAGGWLSWLVGGSGGASQPQSAAAPQESDVAPELSAEDYSRLVDLVTEQEQGMRLGTETPFTLLSRISARITSASALLVGADDTRVLRGGLEGIQLTMSRYPETLRVELGVAAMGVESPEGPFIQTGAQLKRLRSATDLTDELEGPAAADAEPGPRAMAVTVVQKPQDGSADAVLDVVLMPSYVYFSAACVDRVVEFFKTPQQLDLSSLGAQATTQLERARRLAAEYAAAALQSKPKLLLHLVLDAPKVAIPAVDGAGHTTLALDFGRFVIETDSQTAGTLPSEEAALYECVRLNVCDVAAFVADGAFDWQRPDQGHLVPLLERTGMDIALQAARFADPRYPAVRLQPSVPTLHFYLSPGRMGRMLRVVRAVMPAADADAGTAGAGPGPQAGTGTELWRQHASCEGELRVLTWTGLGRSTATWCPRYGVLYQGKLYLYEGPQPGAKLAATENVWTARRVVRVPPDTIGGIEHVVALCPESLDLTRLAESTASLVLRLGSESQADAWYRSLQHSQQEMQELAGESSALLPPDWEDTSSTMSEVDAAPAAAGGPAAAQAPAPESQAPSTLLEVEATLGELAIFGGGRTPDPWWPDEDGEESGAGAAPTTEPSGDGGQPSCGSRATPVPDGFVSVDGEVPLIVLRAASSTCHFRLGAAGMTVHTALGSLEVEDLLVGQRCPQYRFLASSRPGVERVGDDVFFEADERLTSSPSFVRSRSITSAVPQGPGSPSTPLASEDLAQFTLKLRQPGGPEYEGVDTSLDISLSSLYFYCNRPTVAALITLGVDIGAAASAAFDGPEGGAPSGGEGGDQGLEQACNVEKEQHATAGAAALVQAAGPDVAAGGGANEPELEQTQLLASAAGAKDRSMFRLTASLKTLQVVLNYEGSGCHTLSQAAMEQFSLGIDIKPDTSMRITSSLGNVRIVDCTLAEDHPYHQACGLRAGSTNSLVSLEFCSFPSSHRHPSVPEGLQYSTLNAELSELQVIFLYRFLQENLAYLSTMLAMRLPPQDPAAALALPPAAPSPSPSPSEGAPALAQAGGPQPQLPADEQAQNLQPFVLLIDVQASAPSIALPRNTDGLDSIEVDLGSLHLKTRSILAQGAERATAQLPLLVEVVDLGFSGVGCTVVQNSLRGPNIVQNAESGWQLQWRRPLQPEFRGDAPMFDLSLGLPFLKARMTDQEYELVTSVVADNFAEVPDVPAGAAGLNEHYQAIILEQQQALLEQQMQKMARPDEPGAVPSDATRPSVQTAGSGVSGGTHGEAGAALPAREDKSRTSVRVAVSIGEIELEVLRHLEGLPTPLPLARFTLADLSVAFRNTEQGSMFVGVNLPRVEARDLRPEVPPEQSLVISSAHKASFLMLDWAASPGMSQQALALTLQKPLLVVELSFLLAITQFFVPSFVFIKDRPIPFATHDVALTGERHVAEGDLYLSPSVRLLADTPGASSYEYDGRGHRLVLPDKEHLDGPLPLILVGSGRTLRLRNVRVVNCASLPVCLQFGPGAKLLASPDDGVEMLAADLDDPELTPGAAHPPPPSSPTARRTLSPRRPALRSAPDAGQRSPRPPTAPSATGEHAAQLSSSPPKLRGAAQAAALPLSPPAPQPQRQKGGTIQVVLSAVGLGLQFVRLDPGARQGSQPGSRPGSSAASRQGSRADLAQAVSQRLITAQSAALPSAQAQGPPARSVQMLAASLDLDVAYRLQDTEQSGQVQVQGLRVETRFLSDVAGRLAQRDQQDVRHKRKLRGQREGSVLDPCRIGLAFRLVSASEEEGRPTLTDIRLESSDLRLTLSPAVLELGSFLAASAMQPLMQPQPSAPLASCNQFERVWSFDLSALLADQSAAQMAAGLALLGAEAGVTVWRAKTPTGYATTGDVVTPGTSQPSFEVLAAAVNSGLAAYPTSFVRVWEGGGGAIWRPVPPPGYAAVGDVFTLGSKEPQLSEVVCLHEGTLVDCAVGERLSLPPQLPHAASVTAAAAAELQHVELWCLDNSMGTFLAATAQVPLPEQTYDLRTPLGVPPAQLLAMAASPEAAWASPGIQSQQPGSAPAQPQQQPRASKAERPADMFKSFQSSRRDLRAEEEARLTMPSVVDFRRIWFCAGPGGVSIWRPLAPPGYVALGDCLMAGQDPPGSACVVQDTGAEEFPQAQGHPLVKAPRGFEPAWEDTSSPADARLVLWRPVPYPGYVAMGCVATLNTDPPPRNCVKCLRQDAVTRAGSSSSPTWSVRQERHSRMPPLTAWTVDDKLHTFVVVPAPPESLGRGEPQHAWALRQSSSEQAEVPPAQAAGGGVNIVAKAGQARVLLEDGFHVPLLDVSLGAVEAGVRGPTPAVVQAYLGCKVSLWSYNGAVKHWEPVVEPWDVIAQGAANYGSRASAGIEPGVSVSFKSSNDCVYTTLAFSALHSMLTAYSDWQQLHVLREGDPASGALATGEATAMHMLVANRLGVECAMELDYGDHLELAKLAPGATASIRKPPPSFPMRQGDTVLSAGALPHDLLLLDIKQATVRSARSSADGPPSAPPSTSADDSGRRLVYCSVRLEPDSSAAHPQPGARSISPSCPASWFTDGSGSRAPVRTRPLPVGADGAVTWAERLMLALPLHSGSADQTLVFEVWDAAAAGGRGVCLGSGQLKVPVRVLEPRQEHAAVVLLSAPDPASGAAKEAPQGDAPAGPPEQAALQCSYMLQKQWSFAKAGGGQPSTDAWSAEASTAGQRAITLASQPGTWTVIPAFGQTAATGRASSATGTSASITPLVVGKEELIVESAVTHGTRRELLRALCQLVNNTDLTLEACLVDVEDGDWQLVAARAGSISGTFSADSVEEEVFENERFGRSVAGSQWAATNLQRGQDPCHFQYALRESDAFPQVDPPPGWEWESSWHVNHGPSTDADGWAYGPDFKSVHFPPPQGAHKPGMNDFVRRRRWVRRRRRVDSAPPPSQPHAAPSRPEASEPVVTRRDVLGRAAPGESLPLPLGWSKPGRQLQLRPLLPVSSGTVQEQSASALAAGAGLQSEQDQQATPEQAVHDWSCGAADGRHTLRLDSLDDGMTRLVCCASLGTTELGSTQSELEASNLWFSLSVEGDILAGSKHAKPLTDWRLVVSAPLRLTNQLPVPCSLLVWEQQPGGTRTDLVGRQTVQMASGATVPIHTADVRRAVSVSVFPEAYEWAEDAPVVLTDGFSARGRDRQQLPDRFRLIRPGATTPLEVFIQRNIEWGPWLLGAKEELNTGAVVAAGVPMSVVLLAPLWVVNATSLALDAVVVSLEAAAPPPKPGHGASFRGQRPAPAAGFRSNGEFRVVSTDADDPAQGGEFRQRRFVAPSTMELLSYPLPSFTSTSQRQIGSGGGGTDQPSSTLQRQYGVRLRVAGSGWTPALALAAGVAASTQGPGQQQVSGHDLEDSRPVLIRALVRQTGLVNEVVARLEVTSFGNSQVLRIEPHIVISNRTPVPLQLLQSRLELLPSGPGAQTGAQGRPAGAVVAEGGSSFSQAGSSTAAVEALAGPSLVRLRPSHSHLALGDSGAAAGSAGTLSASCWDRVPSLVASGSSPLVRLSASSFRQSVQRNAVLDVPAGAAAMPLALPAGLPNHTLSFRCVPPAASAAAAAADSLPMWSRPVTVRVGAEAQVHVLVPVITDAEEEQAPTASSAAEHQDAAAPASDAAHLTAARSRDRAAGSASALAVAVLRLSVHRRGAGAVHVVLESMQSDPPYLLENRTRVPLQYRQAHVKGAPFHTLEPFSAAGYAWEHSVSALPQELELQEGGSGGVARVYPLDALEDQDGNAAPSTRLQALPLSGPPGLCSVRVAYFEQVITGPLGIEHIGGEGSGVLGRGGIDRVMQVAPGHEPLLTAGPKALAPSRPSVSIAFELLGLEVSVVDHTPRELLLLSATGLRAGVTLGSNPASSYKTMRLTVQRLQLDDLLPGTPFPVVLAPALQQGQQGHQQQPVLHVNFVSVQGGPRGRSYLPLLAIRWPVTLQLAVNEALVWAGHDMVQRLQCDLEAESEAAGPVSAVTAADIPVRIRLLAVDNLSTQISFQGDPFSRPRDVASGVAGSLIDLADFQAAPITLQGLSEGNLVMLQSALTATIVQHIRSQLFYVGLSLLRSFGLVGGTSRALGALSTAVAKLAHGSASSKEQQDAKQARKITDVGEGMLEGAGAIGTSVLRGFRGLIEKPLQGAQQAGVQGAVKGVAKGIIGAVANPVSGMLDALSSTAEGFDATFGKPREHLLVTERRRPARVITGEGKLLPMVRHGSTKQSCIEAIGQALLWNTLLAGPDGLRQKRHMLAGAYEEHFCLPSGRVLLLTSSELMLVHAPGFAELDGAAEIGALSVSDVAPGQVQWMVLWNDVLAFELRWSREGMRSPDRLVVHRRGVPSAVQEEESLAHQTICFQGTEQASQIKLVAEKVLRKYYLDPLRRNQLWSRRHAANALPPGTVLEQLPLTMPCLDFALTWHTNPRKSPVVSFWRPLAPAGYRAVGDVVSLGLEPPSAPVPCFRNDAPLRTSRKASTSGAGAGASAQGQAEPPAAAPPREFSLIWRHNGKRPVTMWMPVAPPGYAALGAVVRGEPEVPAADEYVCIRSDLTAEAAVFNSPIWQYDPLPALQAAASQAPSSSRGAPQARQFLPHHPETWRVSCWQVDNNAGTFIAVRAFARPPPGVARTWVGQRMPAAPQGASGG